MELNERASEIHRSFFAGAMVMGFGFLAYQAFTHNKPVFGAFAVVGVVLLLVKTVYVIIKADRNSL